MSIDVVADSSLNSVKGRSHWSDCDTCLGLLFFLSALHSFVSSFLRFFVPSFFLQFFFHFYGLSLFAGLVTLVVAGSFDLRYPVEPTG